MADEKMTPEVHSNEFDRKPVFKNNKERIRWYLDEIDTYKEDMGKWYTIFIRRVIPMLVFFIPMNIIGFRSYEYIALKYFGGLFQGLSSTIGVAIWLVAMLIFLAILIFLPRFATFCEFVLGTAFYAFVFRSFNQFAQGLVDKPIITNAFGFFVAITLGVFLFMKLVFLVLEIMYHIVFHGEKEPRAYKDGQGDDLVL